MELIEFINVYFQVKQEGIFELLLLLQLSAHGILLLGLAIMVLLLRRNHGRCAICFQEKMQQEKEVLALAAFCVENELLCSKAQPIEYNIPRSILFYYPNIIKAVQKYTKNPKI